MSVLNTHCLIACLTTRANKHQSLQGTYVKIFYLKIHVCFHSICCINGVISNTKSFLGSKNFFNPSIIHLCNLNGNQRCVMGSSIHVVATTYNNYHTVVIIVICIAI